MSKSAHRNERPPVEKHHWRGRRYDKQDWRKRDYGALIFALALIIGLTVAVCWYLPGFINGISPALDIP
ncbi:MAG TPA: hypothetical protein VK978_05165 [Candidatus Saccharimonadales bacterium]|nr:hypothetical protein [Candidatus Saccharimonadales bacterium]